MIPMMGVYREGLNSGHILFIANFIKQLKPKKEVDKIDANFEVRHFTIDVCNE